MSSGIRLRANRAPLWQVFEHLRQRHLCLPLRLTLRRMLGLAPRLRRRLLHASTAAASRVMRPTNQSPRIRWTGASLGRARAKPSGYPQGAVGAGPRVRTRAGSRRERGQEGAESGPAHGRGGGCGARRSRSFRSTLAERREDLPRRSCAMRGRLQEAEPQCWRSPGTGSSIASLSWRYSKSAFTVMDASISFLRAMRDFSAWHEVWSSRRTMNCGKNPGSRRRRTRGPRPALIAAAGTSRRRGPSPWIRVQAGSFPPPSISAAACLEPDPNDPSTQRKRTSSPDFSVRREKARLPCGCETHASAVVSVGSSRSGARR